MKSREKSNREKPKGEKSEREKSNAVAKLSEGKRPLDEKYAKELEVADKMQPKWCGESELNLQ